MKRKLGMIGIAAALLGLAGCLAMEPEPVYPRPSYNNYWVAPHAHWDRDDWHRGHWNGDHDHWHRGHRDRD